VGACLRDGAGGAVSVWSLDCQYASRPDARRTVVTFGYQEYIDFVESLPDDDPRIQKEIVASSGEGRFKTYRIRITNPRSRSPHKLRIALCKTSHAYERSGFFIARGAIEWLLSGDPAANLDHIEWSIYPCLDPQAAHDGCDYIEQAELIMDDGRRRGDTRSVSGAIWDPETGEIASQRYHVLTDVHMWELRNVESYKYNDPFAPSGHAGNGVSRVEADLLAFWPYWYEYGIDHFDHENKWPPARTETENPTRTRSHNARPEDFGGALVTHLELPFYGKDDIDPRQRLAQQGRQWARSHSQAYLRMQRDRGFWSSASPGGEVDVAGATFLETPTVTLVEDLVTVSGQVEPRVNADGRPMSLYHEVYEHGIGQRCSSSVVYAVPEGADTFCAMVGVDDSSPAPSPVQFIMLADGNIVFESRPLNSSERQLVLVRTTGARELTLSARGPAGVLANWGGAKFTAHDPEAVTLPVGSPNSAIR
jgi:hypothetical protein